MTTLRLTFIAFILLTASCNTSPSNGIGASSSNAKIDSAKALVDSITTNTRKALLKELPDDEAKLKVDIYFLTLDSLRFA